MSVKIRNSRGRLYLDIYHGGKRHWEALGLSVSSNPQANKDVMRLAEMIRSKREQEIAAGVWGVIPAEKRARVLVEYAEEVQSTKRTQGHLYKVLPYLRDFAGSMALREVTPDWLEKLKAHLLAQEGLRQVTAAHYYAAVVHVLHRAKRAKIIAENPAEDVKAISIPEAQKLYLEVADVERLASAPPDTDLGYEIYRGFLFDLNVGIRVSDVKALRYGDLIPTPTPHIDIVMRKGQHPVSFPVNSSAMKILGDLGAHDPAELVFPVLTRTLTEHTQYFKMWAKRAGVKKVFGWHTARHTFAVRLLEEGADIFTVSKLLGHKNIKTTMVYAKATVRMKREAVDRLPEVEVSPKPSA